MAPIRIMNMLIYMYMYMDIHVEHSVGYLMSLFGLMAVAENMNNQKNKNIRSYFTGA